MSVTYLTNFNRTLKMFVGFQFYKIFLVFTKLTRFEL